MKNVVIILFLFYAKMVATQTLYMGANTGLTNYQYRPVGNNSGFIDSQFGLCSQYTFKGNAFSYEGCLTYNSYGPNGDEGSGERIADFTITNYLSFNFLHKYKKVSLQFNTGLFYTHYFTTTVLPENDFGPALAINLSYKISKQSYLGLELSHLYGLNTYTWHLSATDVDVDSYPYTTTNISGTSNPITYTTLSIKYIHKI